MSAIEPARAAPRLQHRRLDGRPVAPGLACLRARSYDAIVVGGGHNGLTTAAYLARAGLRCACSSGSPILGGACVTEEVWPGARISRARYVVSMLQPKVVADLRLRDYGYRAMPLDPAYAALTDEGPIFFFNEPARTAASIARHLEARRRGVRGIRGPARRTASFLRPMMLREPPALGSITRPTCCPWSARAAARPASDGREVHDLVRMFAISVADLLDNWVQHPGLKGSLASTGVVGVSGRPADTGERLDLLHHALGELDGVPGGWGQVVGGMGAISLAIARSAEEAGARCDGCARWRRSTCAMARRRRHARRRRGDQRADRRLRSAAQDDVLDLVGEDTPPRRWSRTCAAIGAAEAR